MFITTIAEFCWIVFTVFVIMGAIGRLYKPVHCGYKAKNVEFIIVTVASNSVRNCLIECVNHHKAMCKNLSILLDDGSDLLPELRKTGHKLIVVPKSYRPDLIGKGRAMNYAIETHINPDDWICWLDDDNLLLDHKFLYEIPYYEKRGYVATNPILTPRMGKSVVTFIADWIRVWDDKTLFKLFTGLLKTPLLGLHGEMLTVKGSVLKEIGYNDRTITEDFRFASKLVRKHYKTWQSESKVSIKSANTVKDLMKQRGRWYKGIAKDTVYCPILMRLFVSLRLFMWTIGIFGSWLFVAFWIHTQFWYALPAGLCYWGVYLYGTYQGGKPWYVFLIPAYGIVECLSIFVGLRQKKFVVIDKN